jgi:hypothetical protein
VHQPIPFAQYHLIVDLLHQPAAVMFQPIDTI